MAAKKINLALQGGGAHGAYTWGVIDRLLEDTGRIAIDGVSGTSAGAMNAAVLANGFVQGGYDGARELLDTFWKKVSDAAQFSPFQQHFFSDFLPTSNPWNLDSSPTFMAFDTLSRFMSPYQLNPSNYNPLKEVLEDTLNVSELNSCSMVKVFVTATRVCDGQPRVFRCDELTVDVLLASACLPLMFQAVEIDGIAYWDGGFTGNPAIWPLIYHCKSPDVMLIQINPKVRPDVPTTSSEIINRMNEITFNSSLIAEMRAIQFVSRLIENDELDQKRYKKLNVHMIERPEEMMELNASSKLNATWEFLQHLKQLGRQAAEHWLDQHYGQIGKEGTLDIQKTFLNKRMQGELD